MTTELEALTQTIRRGRKKPIMLLQALYPKLKLDDWQEEAIRAAWFNPRVALVSCNGAGKTLVMALLVILSMLCYPPVIIVTTAGSWTQVRRQLWKEIHRWWSLLPEVYQFGILNTTDWEISQEWYAIGISTNNPGLFEGFHGPHVRVFVDEAKSVEQGIFDSINRIFSGKDDVKCFQASSTGRSAGPHFDAFHGKAERWTRITVSPFEAYIEQSGKEGKRKALKPTERLSEEFIQEMREEYGEDSALYRSMILSRWTEQSEFKLFDLHTLSEMEASIPDEAEIIDYYMGVDVARGGDDECAVCVVADYTLEEEPGKIFTGLVYIHGFHTDDVMVLKDLIKEKGMLYNIPRHNIMIDEGSFGGTLIDVLRREKWDVKGIQFGAGSEMTSPNCKDLVSELWWKASRKANEGLYTGVIQSRLRSQLNHRKYHFTDKDELKVESKREMRKRISKEYPNLAWKSPDWADAYLLACYRGLTGKDINADKLGKYNPGTVQGLSLRTSASSEYRNRACLDRVA